MVADRPDETALSDERGSLTWAELDARVDRWVGVLRGAGLTTGDRVAFVLGNRRETFEALLACLHTGVVAVPVNWRLTAPEIGYILADSGSRGVLTETAYRATVAEAVRGSGIEPALEVVVDEAGLDGLPVAPAGEPCSGAVLLYTSGTTGQPKGVVNPVLQAGAPLDRVAATTAGLGAALGIPEGGRALLVGPWYHSAQLFFSQFPLLRGCTLVMRQ